MLSSKVQAQVKPNSFAAVPVSGVLQRQCACGTHTIAGGKCDSCQKKKGSGNLQRAANAGPVNEVPPIVHEVLRSSGQPLDTNTRSFFEPRFDYDFSHVRVHTDEKAAESARAVNARAYTVGRDMVFDAGGYQPKTDKGRQLLAHELTHVIQQSGLSSGEPRALGDPDSHAEREAGEVTAQSVQPLSSTPTSRFLRSMVSRDVQPAIRRWKIGGNTATSNDESDTLGGLAQKAGAHINDWKCIKPISQRTSTLPKPPANFDARYELYVQIGDTFDISNLTATTGTTVHIYLFGDGTQAADAKLAKLFYPGSTSSKTPGADAEFDTKSSSGGKPISDLVIFGHAGGDTMWGDASSFTPKNFNPEEDVQTFSLASVGAFPRRCWFTRNATARAVGCDSETWGQDFAAHYLRAGATVTTTTKSVRPTCTPPLNFQGRCRSFNGLDFAATHLPGTISLDGPFWSVEDFHAGKFWKTIKGKL